MLQKYKTAIILFILITCSFLLAFPDVRYDQLLTDEDGWIENIGALAFLVAAILFFLCFWRSAGHGLNFGKLSISRNWVFLALGLLFFVAFGEEISWGQRIFGWATPQTIAELNYQQETNIHNLDFFTFKHETENSFWSLLFVINAGRLFFYFWFSYMVLLPLSNKFFAGFRGFIKRVNVPLPPIWAGMLMIANLVISKTYKIFTSAAAVDYSGSIDEIMEGNYAIIIAAWAISLFKSKQYFQKEKPRLYAFPR